MRKPHIELKNNALPGIIGLLNFDTDTAKPLSDLAETILRRDSTLSRGEREMIAAWTSRVNNCKFCFSSHGAAAAVTLGVDPVEFIENLNNKKFNHDLLNPKIVSLLQIAGHVAEYVEPVPDEMIKNAVQSGVTDQELHDTVLIASAFCMYNRYVEGLNTVTPPKAEDYVEVGKRLKEVGYLIPIHETSL